MKTINEFDIKAEAWDNNPMHFERSRVIAESISRIIPLNKGMAALEFGAGTGITSFLLRNMVKEIIMMDNSEGMVKIMNEKIKSSGASNLKALNFDLEQNDYEGIRFDLIFNQMVLHHVIDIQLIIKKFRNILNPAGFIAIADLYSEDGSFHGKGFNGHNGFDPSVLAGILTQNGFENTSYKKVFTINKALEDNTVRDFDVFLLTANLKK